MTRNRKLPSNYFKLVNPIIIILHTAALGLLVVTYVDHKYITPQHLGPIAQYATLVATEYKFALKLGLLALVGVHIIEAMFAVYKCQKLRLRTTTTIAWTLQTLYMGLFSLRFLLWPQKPAPSTAAAAPKQTAKAKAKKQK
ncbi:uncharacterized protein LOC121879277 [Homarus americanus]|nr:uncharacterized protein LOC121879277 [Homarus americanus]